MKRNHPLPSTGLQRVVVQIANPEYKGAMMMKTDIFHTRHITFKATLWYCLAAVMVLSITLASCNSDQKQPYAGENAQLLADIDFTPDLILWSPTGDKFALCSSDWMLVKGAIYIYDLNKQELRLILQTPEGGGVISIVAWSPDSQQLIFYANGREYTEGLRIVDVNGNHPPEFLAKGVSAAWYSESKLAVKQTEVTVNKPNLLKFYLYDPSTKTQELFYNQEVYNEFGFSWSPEGDELTFALREKQAEKYGDIAILEVDTGELTMQTTDHLNNYPVWSPTRNMIAYYKHRKVDYGFERILHIMNPERSCDVQIPGVSEFWSHTWSPDGRKIAFLEDEGIYLIDLVSVFGEDFLREGWPCP